MSDQASVDAALTDADDIVLINNAGYEVQSSVEQLTDDLMRPTRNQRDGVRSGRCEPFCRHGEHAAATSSST